MSLSGSYSKMTSETDLHQRGNALPHAPEWGTKADRPDPACLFLDTYPGDVG